MVMTSSTKDPVRAVMYNKSHSCGQSLRESLPKEKGLCPLAEGQQRWGQAGLQWEGVPESKGAATEEALSNVPHKTHLQGW